MVDADEVELDVPEQQQEVLARFKLRAGSQPGEGEVWVTARQDVLTLVRLKLRIDVTEATQRVGATQREMAAPDARLGAGPASVLRLIEIRGTPHKLRFELHAAHESPSR